MEKVERVESVRWSVRVTDLVGDLVGGNTLAHLFAWLICSVIIALSLVILWMTFVPGVPFESRLSLSNYSAVFDSEILLSATYNTALVGLGTVAIALFFGIPLGWLLNRTDIPFRSLLITLLGVTVIIPGLVKAMGWLMLLSPKVGLINRLLMDLLNLKTAPFEINSISGIAFVQGLMLTPTMFFLISGPCVTWTLPWKRLQRSLGRIDGKHYSSSTCLCSDQPSWEGLSMYS